MEILPDGAIRRWDIYGIIHICGILPWYEITK